MEQEIIIKTCMITLGSNRLRVIFVSERKLSWINEMTGRDLIVYILESHLEDVELFSDVTKPFLIPLEKAAVELECGMATVMTLLSIGKIKGIRLNGEYYIFSTEIERAKRNA